MQASSLVPLLLAPLGVGAGGLAWGGTTVLAFLACQVVGFALDRVLGMRERFDASRLLHMGWGMTAAMSAGFLAVVLPALFPGIFSPVAALVGAGVAGWAQVCVCLTDHRLLMHLDAAQTGLVLCIASGVSVVTCLLYIELPLPWFALLSFLTPFVGRLTFVKSERRAAPGKVPWTPCPAEVLGLSQLSDCRRAAVVMTCAFALFSITLWTVGIQNAQSGVLAQLSLSGAVVAGLVCSVCALCILVLGKMKTLSLTFVFRIGLPPLIIAAVLVLVPEWGQGMFPGIVVLLAFFVGFTEWGYRLLTLGFLRSGVYPEGVIVSMARCGQALGAAFVAIVGLVFDDSALLTSTQALLGLLAIAFVICVPAHEPHVRGSAGRDVALPADVPQIERYAFAALRFGLTARETEVLALLAGGMDAPGIAHRLCISRPTVNTHIQHLYAKVGVHSKTELLARTETAE